MFPGDNENELEGGCLRSGRRFWSRQRATTTRRGSCRTTRGEDYELVLHFDEGSCDEEEYNPIFEKQDKEEAPYPEY